MRITYILDRPELGGGVKVVFQHAHLLLSLGHHVTVLGRGAKPDWVNFQGAYVDYHQNTPQLDAQDLVIGTYWTTIPLAEYLGVGPIAHFCQGFEGDYPHLVAVHTEIEAIYQRNLPTWVVAPHLGDLMRSRFDRDFYLVPPPLDPHFRPAFRLRPRSRPWIAVHGIFECDWKGVVTALKAVRHLRETGLPCRVLRVGLLPLSIDEKNILSPDKYLHCAPPQVVAREMRHCDVLLFPSLATEGFGLPLLEAMVSKVPAVASDIPSTRFMGKQAVTYVPPHDVEGFAAAAKKILQDPHAWRQARQQGYEAAQRFRPETIAQELVAGVTWAIEKVGG
ncbi:MAG: glycosyltransferase [Anaerolineae bacterium]|nr:glycosyltransferase [Anaerolineae bacterium]